VIQTMLLLHYNYTFCLKSQQPVVVGFFMCVRHVYHL
jgi:hypothetical protein